MTDIPPDTDKLNPSVLQNGAPNRQLVQATDLQLFGMIANADKTAMAEFIHRYYGKMCKYITRQIGRQHDCEDIAQEAFIKVWQHAPSWVNHTKDMR